jgi:hypothetical protein
MHSACGENGDGSKHVHLNSFAKVVASTLFLDDLGEACQVHARQGAVGGTHMLVDLAGGDVVVSGQSQGKVPFVVAKIQIDFGT